MKKTIPTSVLLALGIVLYVAACGLVTWVNYAYEDITGLSSLYLWVWGGAALYLTCCTDWYDEYCRSAARTPRWVGVVLMLCGTFVLYVMAQDGQINRTLLYLPAIWWIIGLTLFGLGATLYEHSRFRRPKRAPAVRSGRRSGAITLLAMAVPILVVMPLYFAVLQPVSVSAIRAAYERDGWRYQTRIDYHTEPETPLGVYMFAHTELNRYECRYYDVLTGAWLEQYSYENPY